MNWHRLFRPLKNEPKPLVHDSDKKMMFNLHRRLWPSFAQLRYLGRFLDKKEKIAINGAIAVIIITLISWGGVVFSKHHTTLPKPGGEFIEALVGQPKLINPIFAPANDVDADISPLLYAGLFGYSPSQKLVPELAAAYTISDDRKVYTIKLREDAVWTDGEKIDADDVVFTFETIQNPETNSPLYPSFQGVTLTRVGDFEVSFTLKEPYAPFLSSLTVGIIPEHIFVEIPNNNLRLAKENLQPQITSGAWTFSKLIKNDAAIQTYILTKNEKYFGQIPYIKNITFKFYQDYAQAAEDLHAKEVMAIGFLPRDLEEKYAGKNLVNYTLHIPQYTALFFNQGEQAALKDSDVRLALSQAINKKTVVDEALGGRGEVIEAPILAGFTGYYPDIKKNEFNPDEANKLLDKNWTRVTPEEYFNAQRAATLKARTEEIKNLPEYETNSTTLLAELTAEVEGSIRNDMRPDQTFYRQDKKGNLLTLTITTADTPEYRQAAETIARLWRAIGIPTSIQAIAGKQVSREALKDRNYEILLYGEILGDDPDPYPFWHSSQTDYPGLNLAMFSNRNADKMLEEARVTNDVKSREKIYHEFQDTLIKEIPAIFLYSPTYNYLIDRDVKGVEVNRIFSPPDRFNGLDQWYIKTKWGWR
ncbi:MAG: ABC transporter substrate-binding protein [Patescibacteria group bacterium]|nr:ABC transporter substrate-binding protein [Patescibacteria group bacterium]